MSVINIVGYLCVVEAIDPHEAKNKNKISFFLLLAVTEKISGKYEEVDNCLPSWFRCRNYI